MSRDIPHDGDHGKIGEMKGAIEASFLALYENLPLERISVSQVAERACCSRATFYRYFKNVEDLLAKLERENTGSVICADIIRSSLVIPLERASDDIIEFYDSRRDVVRVLATGSHGREYLEQQTRTFKPMLHSLIVRAFDLTPMQQDYAAEYMARTKTVMIKLWIDRGYEISLAQVNKMCDNIVEKSFWTSIADRKRLDGSGAGGPERIYADRHEFTYPWKLSDPS